MSWYLFRESPSLNHRGKKVEGYRDSTRTRVNLSWGINESFAQDDSQSTISKSIIPTTFVQKNTIPEQQSVLPPTKVLTETSEDQREDELARLLRQQNEPRAQRDLNQFPVRARSRGQSINGSEVARNYQSQKEYQAIQRMRYLQNSLLPASRKDSMGPIFNHELCREVPMDASRVSGRSSFHNKKNESNVVLGDGFNVYHPPEQPAKELGDKLREMYEYEESRKKRMDASGVRFG